jgi:DoxX-like family
MTTAVQSVLAGGSNRKYWIGWVMSGLVIAFMLMDATMKLLALRVVLQAGDALGFPGPDMARGLGTLLLLCTLLYAAPRTAVLGAILLTGYLGGAVATHVRMGNPLFTHVLFGVYLGVLLWGGLCLRSADLRRVLFIRTRG